MAIAIAFPEFDDLERSGTFALSVPRFQMPLEG